MSGGERLDSEHAFSVRDAANKFEEALRQAAADGVVVRIALCEGSGFQRGKDRSTRFTSVGITEVFRPL